MITVLYFARLRESLGKSSEQIKLPAGYRFRLEQGGEPEPVIAK